MEKKEFIPIGPFKELILENFPFIEVDFDAITNYQLMCKVIEYVDKIAQNEKLLEQANIELVNAFNDLKIYVENYLDNLDVQTYINNKLDEMAESGELVEVIAQFLELSGILAYNTLDDLENASNLINGNFTRIFGKLTYNDGLGAYYKIRNLLTTDVIDGDNIIALVNYPELVGEKLISKTEDDVEYLLNNSSENINIYAPSLDGTGSQGLTLIVSNEKTILVDLGRSEDTSRNYTFLESKLGDRKIDYVIITHYHNDHIGGLSDFSSLYSDNVKFYLPMDFESYYTGGESNISTVISNRASFIDYLDNNSIDYTEVDEDVNVTIDKFNLKLRNSTPNAYSYYGNHNSKYNAYSMNVLITYYKTKFLIPADSLEDTENYLLSIGQVEKINILSAPHHGYERRGNIIYKKIINPDYLFISQGTTSYSGANLLTYDFEYNTDPRITSQEFGEVNYIISKFGIVDINGDYVRQNMYLNKSYEVYVNPSFTGTSYGTQTNPYKSINQALCDLPKTLSDITINLADGTYTDIRFKNMSNNITFKAINAGEVIMNNCYFVNCTSITCEDIVFNDGTINTAFCKVYFNRCSFSATSTESGNNGLRASRSIVSANECSFSNCHTGFYAQTNCQAHLSSCTFNCATYAVYSDGSYVGLKGYTLTSGTLRPTGGGSIVTEKAGTTASRPVFNNSNYMRGYLYFDTTLAKPIFYYNSGSQDGWVDATGTSV